MIRHVLAFIMIILMSGAAPAEASPTFQAVRDTYAQARDGQIEPEKARDVLEAFLKGHPAHPVATAYLGSVRTMIARDAFFPFTKLTNVNQGIELLDAALERLDRAEVTAEHDGRLDILMVSGLTNAALPGSFGRRLMAERDLTQAKNLPSFQAVPAGTKAKVYAWLAVFAATRDAAEADALMTLARAEDTAVADALWDEER